MGVQKQSASASAEIDFIGDPLFVVNLPARNLHAAIFPSVFNVVLPKNLEVGDFFVSQGPLHSRWKSHHQRSRRDNRPGTDERTRGHKRPFANAYVVEQNRPDTYQAASLDVASVQRRTMAHRHLFFKNRRVRSMTDMNHGIVLNVRAIADADVMNVAANRAVAPDRGFFAKVNVADDLGTGFDIRGWVNLRVNATKRSNHDFGEIVTYTFELCVWCFVLDYSYKAQSTKYQVQRTGHVLN